MTGDMEEHNYNQNKKLHSAKGQNYIWDRTVNITFAAISPWRREGREGEGHCSLHSVLHNMRNSMVPKRCSSEGTKKLFFTSSESLNNHSWCDNQLEPFQLPFLSVIFFKPPNVCLSSKETFTQYFLLSLIWLIYFCLYLSQQDSPCLIALSFQRYFLS